MIAKLKIRLKHLTLCKLEIDYVNVTSYNNAIIVQLITYFMVYLFHQCINSRNHFTVYQDTNRYKRRQGFKHLLETSRLGRSKKSLETWTKLKEHE